MKIVEQTASKLVIHNPIDKKELMLPGVCIGMALAIVVLMLFADRVYPVGIFLALGMAAYGISELNGVLRSETLIFDKAVDKVRCDRKTLFSTQRWQASLSELQNVSVGTQKSRHKKANGNYATRWFYTLKLVANDTPEKELIYHDDGDSVDAAYYAITQFLGPVAAKFQKQRPGEGPARRFVPDAYQTWRDTIFTLSPGQAGSAEDDPNQVYGVLMDIGMLDKSTGEPWAISLTAFLSGEASFRPTPGGGLSGLGRDSNIAQIAQDIVRIAQTLLPTAFPIEDRALPEPELVQFFFFTPGGVYGVADYLSEIQTPNEPLGELLKKFGIIRQFADRTINNKN